ncbi:MAG: acetyl-CoA carboxylase biotin carboxyl carrier protein subunit, partial [Porticoccaceae bacterium]
LFTPHGFFQGTEIAPDLGLNTEDNSGGSLRAPMNGTVVSTVVATGEKVCKGDTLLVMEAMKMEHSIEAPDNGLVTEFYFQAGDLVDGGAELLSFEAEQKGGE